MKKFVSLLLSLLACLALLLSPLAAPAVLAQTGPEPDLTMGGQSLYTAMVIDDTAGSGFSPSIAIDPVTRTPYISYYRLTGQVMLAHPVASGGNCGPNNSWLCEEIASNVAGGHNAIDIYNDPVNHKWKLTVVYQNMNSKSLRAKTYSCTDGSCAWNSVEQVIDVYAGADNVVVGYYASAKYDSKGVLHVAYYWMNLTTDKPDGMKYAYYKGGRLGNCGNLDSWQCYLVDSGVSVGTDTELTLVNDAPWVVYRDGGNANLKFAMYLGSGVQNSSPCNTASTWFCATYDSNGNVGDGASIATKGGLQISYRDTTNASLKYFNMGQSMVIDSMAATGETQMRSDARNYPVIAYTGLFGGRKYLTIARPYQVLDMSAGNCGLVSGVNQWWCGAVDYDASLDIGNQVAMTVASGNQVMTAYIAQVPGDTTSGQLRFAYENMDQVFLPVLVR